MDAPEFRAESGARIPAVTAEEMREVDRVAVEEVGFGLSWMMENAGRNLAGNARALRGDGPVVVMAGSGGNGGGGLCCARHLANHDVAVEVLLDRDPGDLRGAAAEQFRVLSAMGIEPGEDETEAIASAGLVVDALIGYGLSGAPQGRAAELIHACAGERVLSLDVPSGRNATTGEAPGAVVTPERTVTLALPKTGLVRVPGEVYLADIAIPAAVYERVGIEYEPPFDGEYWLRIEPA